jgi:hypothetical protein
MKGIYLTAEAKQEIESKIAELEKNQENAKTDFDWNNCVVEKNVYKNVLESATILPVEENWEKAVPDGIEEDIIFDYIQDKFKYGVIIQPKQ